MKKAFLLTFLFVTVGSAPAQEILEFGGQGKTFWSCSARVNSFTQGRQGYGDVAVNSEGTTLVTWYGDSPACPLPFPFCYGEVSGQLYDASGFPMDAEFVLNTEKEDPHGMCEVIAFPDAGFLATWVHDGEPGSIEAQLLASDGTFLGENICVSCSVPLVTSTSFPVISANRNGRWVTTWGVDGRVWVQVFEGSVQRKTFFIDNGYAGDVVIAENGEFNVITTWGENPVLLRRFSADGDLLGEPIQVDTDFPYADGGHGDPKIASDAQGRMTVVWTVKHWPAQFSANVCIRQFTWQGEPIGPATPITQNVGQLRDFPDIAMDSAGNFVVVYLVNEGEVLGQRFSADGSRIGHEFVIPNPPWYASGWSTLSGASWPRVSLNDQGRFVVAWHTPGADGWADQAARVFDFNAPDFMRGDANGDGEINLSDAISILGYLFLGYSDPSHPDAADTNDDGSIDLADAIYLISFLFLSDPASLPHPYPYWGFDSTYDTLSQ
jgi:dockerin type I repeat protein